MSTEMNKLQLQTTWMKCTNNAVMYLEWLCLCNIQSLWFEDVYCLRTHTGG